MASIVFDRRRGTYSIQWHDGVRWTRDPVHRITNWKPGASRPRRDPADVTRALGTYIDKEKDARKRGRRDPDRTIREFLESYATAYALDRAAGSVEQLRQAVRNFLAWCAEVKLVKLEDVTPSECRNWIVARAGQTSEKTGERITFKTLTKEKCLLSGAWTQALRLEEIDRNPWSNVEVPAKPLDREKPSWSPDEYAALLRACRPWLRDIITLGCHTGIRISALLGLEWRDVTWNSGPGPGYGKITVRQELDKSSKGYNVPIHVTAHDLLARRMIHRDGDRILAGMRGQPTTMRVTYTAIKRGCERAGLPEPSSPNHHMRRTFGRWAVIGHLTGRPVPLYVVSRWMGHSSVAMTEKYLDIKPDESADWMSGTPDGEVQGHHHDSPDI